MDAAEEFAAIGRRLIEDHTYMTLGTADAEGEPWATPVYYTPDGVRRLYWASSPQATHSRNLLGRPAVSIVIFDSTVPIGGAEAVYMKAVAEEVPSAELDSAAELYGSRLPELRRFSPEELTEPSLFRLYRANLTEHSVLVRGGHPTHGTGVDSRITVDL